MLDFLTIQKSIPKKDYIEISPKFMIGHYKDLMIRGRDFYAIWDEENGMWSTDENVALALIDKELDLYYKQHKSEFEGPVYIKHLWDSDTGMIDKWHKYVQKQLRDNYHEVDSKLIFLNTETTREDYATKRLPYALEEGPTPAYDKLMSTLYSEDERKKIEWAIGAIVCGDSKEIQKFLVMYGAAGTGKSTVLNIIQDLFEGYYSVFDAKSLGSANDAFALESFKANPLLAIQHDGDLSRIEDNTRLNSVVSHELMTINEKFKSMYSMRINAFLFMGTNKPVKITDAKSGIIRRLIDVSPSGNKLPPNVYKSLIKKIKFELGGIATHCLSVYKSDPGAYDNYIPISMLGASNDFYNFILDSFDIFTKPDGITLKSAWEAYKVYCDDANITYPYSQRIFKEELKNYFESFEERVAVGSGVRVRNLYSGFKTDKFIYTESKEPEPVPEESWLKFDEVVSVFDDICHDCPAQYATDNGTPISKWDDVRTKLSDISTSELHYVRVPQNHIVIDFDIPDENGNKSLERNLEEAQKWPETYAELSKSGKGIHLHYIYEGDVSKLSRIYDAYIEIKVFTGKSSLRRKLTKCNDKKINTINAGLPLKEESKVVSKDIVISEKGIIKQIKRNLNKEIHPATKPSIDMIFKILDEAYSSGVPYDVTAFRPDIFAFACNSSHNALYCMKRVNEMKFKSKEESKSVDSEIDKIIFYDVEVFPNLFVVVWKGIGSPCVKMINPTPVEIEDLCKHKLVGFNCRRYDNHILYARMIGYSNEELYELSQRIINGSANAFFSNAYNLSYTDVYDFSSKKQSLKKFEIELGIHHQELGLPWDKPVDESMWELVADYCINDVIATEATFEARKGDFVAREILADIAGGTVNDTTNSLTSRLIFGDNRKPQNKFHYRNLAEPIYDISEEMLEFLQENFPIMMSEPHGEAKSLLPYFNGYSYTNGKSVYRGEDVGEGGFVWAQPGMYGRVVTYDVASMHPHSVTSEYLFGEYTKIFSDLMNARVAIKHKDFDTASKMFDGKLSKYLTDPSNAKMLANALKIAINSVYGLTAAKFDNVFRDKRNIDNIVAKRGALFMIDLLNAVKEKGGNVIHIKTDSIKIENPSDELNEFVLNFGKRYGYDFEVEHIFEKICLVNDAVYIAKCAKDDPEMPGKWTATGTQFQVPYVFKKLFSKEPIEFSDLCETKTVTSALYLDMNEGLPEGEHNYIFVGKAGQFCPMNKGGGDLVREKDGKYNSATGAKGYKWMESEMVKNLGKEQDIDISYYNRLADEAIVSLSEFGDYEWFVSE